MELGQKFKVTFTDNANEFLLSLQQKVRRKIYFNIRKVADGVVDTNLFKKLDGNSDFWEFRTKYNGMDIGCWHFGTRLPKNLWLPRMVSLKRGGRFLQRKLHEQKQ